MNMRIYNLLMVAAVSFAVCACGEKGPDEPDSPAAEAPSLVSVVPADGSEVSGETLEVKFTFDQNVKLPDARKVSIDNEATVSRSSPGSVRVSHIRFQWRTEPSPDSRAIRSGHCPTSFQ